MNCLFCKSTFSTTRTRDVNLPFCDSHLLDLYQQKIPSKETEQESLQVQPSLESYVQPMLYPQPVQTVQPVQPMLYPQPVQPVSSSHDVERVRYELTQQFNVKQEDIQRDAEYRLSEERQRYQYKLQVEEDKVRSLNN